MVFVMTRENCRSVLFFFCFFLVLLSLCGQRERTLGGRYFRVLDNLNLCVSVFCFTFWGSLGGPLMSCHRGRVVDRVQGWVERLLLGDGTRSTLTQHTGRCLSTSPNCC